MGARVFDNAAGFPFDGWYVQVSAYILNTSEYWPVLYTINTCQLAVRILLVYIVLSKARD
jgi:hypothetical protein